MKKQRKTKKQKKTPVPQRPRTTPKKTQGALSWLLGPHGSRLSDQLRCELIHPEQRPAERDCNDKGRKRCLKRYKKEDSKLKGQKFKESFCQTFTQNDQKNPQGFGLPRCGLSRRFFKRFSSFVLMAAAAPASRAQLQLGKEDVRRAVQWRIYRVQWRGDEYDYL